MLPLFKVRYIADKNIKMYRLEVFKFFLITLDNNLIKGNHFGIAIGSKRKQIHLIFRNWNKKWVNYKYVI